jgi:hypothetical protein
MRAMLKPLLFLLAIALTGCATSREVHLANGWLAFEINCGGPLSGFGNCLDKAGDVCTRGYEVLDAEGGVVPDKAAGVPEPIGFASVTFKNQSRKLLVRCK